MEIIVTSRQLKASAVLDMAFDAGLDRPRVVTMEDWDGSPAYLLTFGALACRQTMTLRPRMSVDQAKAMLEAAMLAPPQGAAREIVAHERQGDGRQGGAQVQSQGGDGAKPARKAKRKAEPVLP